MVNQESQPNDDTEEYSLEQDYLDLLGSSNKFKKTADYSDYYSGPLPEYGASMIGSSSVDASQISSSFGKTNEAISLVNQFNSSLLNNIAFIFNFSGKGAYGVYVPELDRAIKLRALEGEMKRSGYEVEIRDDGFVVATPTQEEKTRDQIQSDINRIWEQMEGKGGTVFGINTSDLLAEAQRDAEATGIQDPNLWQWMAVLHIGSKMVHEATHAAGAQDEAAPEAAESAFMGFALPKINEMYLQDLKGRGMEEQYRPLMVGTETRHAKSKGWYKKAQLNYYPKVFFHGPTGSDLAGRMGAAALDGGRAPWGLMAQEDESVPIEKRLGRQYMSPLPPDLSQEHNSYEEQLRKYTRDDMRFDPDASTEELLEMGRTEQDGYELLEVLLENERPQPLLVPMEKAASSRMRKTATLFGWMNNLEVSDGSTIPGLSDRVMEWDWAEEDFAEREKEIRNQRRYNPSYDLKGFYYRWIEPRFHPQLFDDMTQDYSNTHPAKRFAAKKRIPVEGELANILSILGKAKARICAGKIAGTRFIVSEDLVPMVTHTLGHDSSVAVAVYHLGKADGGEEIYSAWVVSLSVPLDKIKDIEERMSNEDLSDEVQSFINEVFGTASLKEGAIKDVLDVTKKIAEECGIKNVYAAGAFPKSIVLDSAISEVDELDINAVNPSQALKLGGLVSDVLGVTNAKYYSKVKALRFIYHGIKVSFGGRYSPDEIEFQLKTAKIPVTYFNTDIYNRDFTINTFIYDVCKQKVLDPTTRALKDVKSKKLETVLDPVFVCENNPLVVLRAIRCALKYGFKIDGGLQVAMVQNAPRLLRGDCDNDSVVCLRDEIKKEDRTKAQELFEEYGISKIDDLKHS